MTTRRNTSGFEYVRKERTRHGTTIYRFRWRNFAVQLIERYNSPEFRAHHAALKAKVEAIKAGLDLTLSQAPQEQPSRPATKPKTFRWLCELYWKSPEFGTKTKASDRTKYQSKRILELCCEEPIRSNHPDKEKFGDYPLESNRAMRLSDLEILRDRAAAKKKVRLPNGKTRTIGGPGAADMRVKHLKRLFTWAVKHREKSHVEHDIAAHLDRIGEDTGGWHTWTTEELEAYERTHPVGTVARLAFDIFQYTGCRISDVIRLGPKHVKDDKDRARQAHQGCPLQHDEEEGRASSRTRSHRGYVSSAP